MTVQELRDHLAEVDPAAEVMFAFPPGHAIKHPLAVQGGVVGRNSLTDAAILFLAPLALTEAGGF